MAITSRNFKTLERFFGSLYVCVCTSWLDAAKQWVAECGEIHCEGRNATQAALAFLSDYCDEILGVSSVISSSGFLFGLESRG